MIKIRILILSFILFVGYECCAQSVSYTYKPLAAEGCTVEYSVTKQDTTYYIIATVKSDRLIFIKESTMLLKTFDGEIIKLYGEFIGNNSRSTGVVSGNIVIPITGISSTAQFEIKPEQLMLFNKGISKVRLSTIPIEHERTFSKDKIGKKLYQCFLRQKYKNEEF